MAIEWEPFFSIGSKRHYLVYTGIIGDKVVWKEVHTPVIGFGGLNFGKPTIIYYDSDGRAFDSEEALLAAHGGGVKSK